MNSMPSIKYMHTQRAVPLTKAACKRCKVKFHYYRRGRHRYFCEACRELERKDANDFFNGQARLRRIAERLLASVEGKESTDA